MLSRTADHLFWMARYIERAENTARMLDVHVQTGLLPQAQESIDHGWRATLGISELQPYYEAKYGTHYAQRQVLDYMALDPSNSSSIWSCLQSARENARAVRGAITTEVWETTNATWLELQKLVKDKALERDPTQFFEWVKFRSHLSRGVTIGTMLKDEAFYFTRLGTFLERADNTARLIDVKYHGLAEQQLMMPVPRDQSEHQMDFYYWTALLRSLSAFEIYRKVYRDVITPARVAELLILRGDMPRSLLACLQEVMKNLAQVANQQSSETERRAGLLHADLHYGRIEDVLQMGLHVYLTNFLERVYDLGNRISRDFLVPLATP